MGQPVTVAERPSSTPGLVRFETNRVLTGTGHEHYRSAPPPPANRPADELARRLFERGGVDLVHVHGNMITLHVSDPAALEDLKRIVEELHLFYHEGDPPPTVQEA